MKLKPGGRFLDKSDSYQSAWFGGSGGGAVRETLSDGRPAVGIHGRCAEDVDAVGLRYPVVVANDKLVRQAADGSLTLKAYQAEIVGTSLQLEGTGESANIGVWRDIHDQIQWPVTFAKPGTFDVRATISCEA